MGYLRIEDTVYKVNIGTGESKKIAHATGDFTLFINPSSSTHNISSSTGTTFTLASSVGTVVNGNGAFTVEKNGTDITSTVTQSGAGNRTFTFATALVSTDTVEIDYLNTNDVLEHTGAGNLNIALENNDYINPKTAAVSVEQISDQSGDALSALHRVY